MCHKVSKTAKRPKARFAYKSVVGHGGNLGYKSAHASGYVSRPVYWRPGRTVYAQGLRAGYEDADGDSTAGIYVFRRLRDAKENADAHLRTVIKVAVDPEDWLTTSECGEMATYRKATMVNVVKFKSRW